METITCRHCGSVVPIENRFWMKVDKNTASGCWEWTAQRNASGYGLFRMGSLSDGTRRTERAHRASWMFSHGPISREECVLHRCDNRACVNPDHLFLGDRGTNYADMKDKGRHLHGESAPWSRLTEDQVREIRDLVARHALSQRQIAERFGVSQGHVSDIVLGKRWGHVS